MVKDTKKTRIMVFGTFDILHKGHLNFFKQARALAKNPFLIVSVAKGENVIKIKGKKPRNSEKARRSNIKKSPLVNKVVPGGLKNHIPHIVKQKPEIIALGYDQNAYVDNLKNELSKQGLKVRIVRLKGHKTHIYKSSFMRK